VKLARIEERNKRHDEEQAALDVKKARTRARLNHVEAEQKEADDIPRQVEKANQEEPDDWNRKRNEHDAGNMWQVEKANQEEPDDWNRKHNEHDAGNDERQLRWKYVAHMGRKKNIPFMPWMTRPWSKSPHLIVCLVGSSVGCLVCWLAGSLVTCNAFG
jgi:hypothetical protein